MKYCNIISVYMVFGFKGPIICLIHLIIYHCNDQIPIIIPTLAVLGLHSDILQDKRPSNPTTRLVEGRNGETSECTARLAPLCSTVIAIKMQMS